jgi:hypothetical protein
MSVVLVIQHANAHAPYCHLVPLPHFSTSHKRKDFRRKKKELMNIKCVFWFYLQLLFETFLILRIQQDMIKNVQSPTCTIPVILASLSRNLNFLDRLSSTQTSNLMKIRSVGAELFHAGGRTVMTKPIAAFRNFANAPHDNK